MCSKVLPSNTIAQDGWWFSTLPLSWASVNRNTRIAAMLRLGYGNDSRQNGPFGELAQPYHSRSSSNVIDFRQLRGIASWAKLFIDSRFPKNIEVDNLFRITQLWRCGHICRESLPYPTLTVSNAGRGRSLSPLFFYSSSFALVFLLAFEDFRARHREHFSYDRVESFKLCFHLHLSRNSCPMFWGLGD
jgi:hypothetical protein